MREEDLRKRLENFTLPLNLEEDRYGSMMVSDANGIVFGNSGRAVDEPEPAQLAAIVAGINALPSLLAEVERLRTAIREYVATRETMLTGGMPEDSERFNASRERLYEIAAALALAGPAGEGET